MSLVEIKERLFAYDPVTIARKFVEFGIVRSGFIDRGYIKQDLKYLRKFRDVDLGTVVVGLIDYDTSYMSNRDKRSALYNAAEREASKMRIEIAEDRMNPEIKNFPLIEEGKKSRVRTLDIITKLQAELLEEATIGQKEAKIT